MTAAEDTLSADLHPALKARKLCHCLFLVIEQVVYADMTVCQILFAVVTERKRPPLDAFDACAAAKPADAELVMRYRELMERCWSDEASLRPSFPDIISELSPIHNALKRRASGSRPLG